MIAMRPNSKRLSKRTLNILFNLADKVAKNEVIEWNTILGFDNPLTYVYMGICSVVPDIDESFEYETVADILTNSIIEGEELSLDDKSKLVKLICENKEKYNIELNTELLITYIL